MIVNNQKLLFASKWMQLTAISLNDNAIMSLPPISDFLYYFSQVGATELIIF